MKDIHKTYTGIDFERYHNGSMPANEMHALEKAALEDPFLADALEGYVHTSSFENDTKELQTQLFKKSKKKNVFALASFAESKWWRIAALLVIIAGAGFIFYQVNQGNKNNTITSDIKMPSTKMADSMSTVKSNKEIINDSIYENQLATSQEKDMDSRLPSTKPQQKKGYFTPEEKEKSSALASEDNSISYSNTDSTNAYKLQSEKGKQASTKYVLKGRVTDTTGAPVGFARVTDKQLNKTIADKNGDFQLQSQDSTATAIASAPGYESKNITLKKDSESTIALNESNESLSEVVVTGYGTKRKRNLTGASVLQGKAAGVQITTAQPPPTRVQGEFDKYIQDNKTPVYDENGKVQTGEITLSFTIDKQGKPQKIKVIKSSCKPCEAAAIRLLENGPAWTGKKSNERKVVIRF